MVGSVFLLLFLIQGITALPNKIVTIDEQKHVATSFLPKVEVVNKVVSVQTAESISNITTQGKMLLIAVCSAPDHFEHREAIRQTWAKISYNNNGPTNTIRHTILFFIGNIARTNKTEESDLEKRIAQESQQNKDIVRLNSFVESYNNLTRKTLAMVKWAVRENFEVMLKVDDDTFVLLDKFYGDVVEYETERNLLYWGKFWGGDDRPVSRATGSKFFVSKVEYSHDTFPDYADGPCYALGSDLMKYLSVHSDTLPIYSLEDAAVGIWLRKAPLNILQIHGNGYMYQRNCYAGNDYYFVNPVTPHEMSVIMNHYSKHQDICSDNYTLEVCSSPRGCLCSPSNNPCWDLPDPTATTTTAEKK